MRSKGLVRHRVQAALAAGLLAFGAAAPAVALAAEGDQEQVGSLAPGQPGTNDPALSPDFDPGGDSTDLPGDAPPVPQVEAPPDPGNDDAGPLEQEPLTDSGAPVVDQGDSSAPATAGEPPPATATDAPAAAEPAPPGAREEPSPSSTTSPEPPAVSTTPAATPPADASPTPAAEPTVGAGVRQRATHLEPTDRADHVVRLERVASSSPTQVRLVAVRSTVGVHNSSEVSAQAVRDAAGVARTHIVRAGESLWSIASDLLGPGAAAAAIGREVQRLWELNKERIGTGDPDLLPVGTRLLVR
jgi:hypothetical protein